MRDCRIKRTTSGFAANGLLLLCVFALIEEGCSASAPTVPAKTSASVEVASPQQEPPTVADPLPVEATEAQTPTAIPPAVRRAYEAGQEAFAVGDLKGAIVQFQQAIDADPSAAPAYVALGSVQQRAGDVSAAAFSYASALSRSPGYGPAVIAKTSLLLEGGRAQLAEEFTRGLLAKFPASASVLTALADVRSFRGDSASAQRLAQQALKEDPDFRPAMVTIARDHYRGRRLDLALYTLTAILDGYGPENPPRDRNNAEARLMRALIFKEQRKRTRAMDELKTVVEARPDWVGARLHLAAYMLEAGNAAEARPLLEGALEFEPSNVLVHVNLGDAYRLLGKPKDALQHLSWVARKNPDLATTHYNLGLVYLFSPEVPGFTEAQAVGAAIGAFEKFKVLVPRAVRGEGDDVNELLARAKNRKSILEALAEDMDDESSEDEEWSD